MEIPGVHIWLFVTVIILSVVLFYTLCVYCDRRHMNFESLGFQMFSLWLYFSFYMWLGYMAVCGPIQSSVFTMYVVPCILGICFVGVLIESGFSHELEYLKNFSQDGTAWECIQNLHLIPLKIYMTVKCYRREYDDELRYTHKIETFKEKEEFSYGSWIDVSETEPQAVHSLKAAVVQIKINPAILFGDQETFEEYKRLATAMINRNLHRNKYIDFSLRIEIPDMKKRFLGYVDLRVRPFWMRPLFFWIATLLWMAWPYRWLFRAKTGKIHYTLKKKIYKSATPTTTEIADSAIAGLVVVNTSVPYVLVPYPPLDTVLVDTLSHLQSSWEQHTAAKSRLILPTRFQMADVDGEVPLPRTPYRPSLAKLNVAARASCLPRETDL